MTKISLGIALLVACITPAWADDSIEAAATGNIVFEKAPELVMQDETLTITKSANKKIEKQKFTIDVDFHFKNISSHDITRKIAFVLPPVQCREDVNSLWRGLDDNGIYNTGLKDFTTTVDGNLQPFTVKTEAMLGKKNITALLTQLGIPLNPCKIQMTSDGKPDPKYGDILVTNHLLTSGNDAAWSENIYFEWTQTFPANKVINVHHRYTPVIGESVITPRTVKEINEQFTKNTPPLKPVWNRSPDTLNQSNPEIIQIFSEGDKKEKRFNVSPMWVRYNLTSGANWNGGIKSFKLIIKDEANAPFAVNEFYKKSDVVSKSVDGNTMSFTIKNFIPMKNLYILYLFLPSGSEEGLKRTM